MNSANWCVAGRNSSKYKASVPNSRDASTTSKLRLRDGLDDRDTRLKNVAHPCAPARGPWRSPATASTPASGRAPFEAPLDRQGSWSHRGELSDGTAPRRVVRPLPARGRPRGGLGQPRGSEPLLQRRSTKLTARLTQRDEGQHKTPQGSHNTAKTQRRHARRANKRAAQDGRRQQDVEPLRFRTKRVDRQPPQPHARPPTRLRSVHT